jgi:alkylmercury lyase
MPATTDITTLADALTAAVPELDARQQELGVNLIRLLAEGEPVSAGQLAERVERPEAEVAAELERWPAVFRDDHGRVMGYAGLTVTEMGEHRLRLDGRELSTWCAYDALFLPELLGQTVSVTSRCPVTGEPISLTVGPEGVSDLRPADTVVSFLAPDKPFDSDVIQSFCHFVHFFSTPEASASWTGEHPGTFVISVEGAFHVGRLVNRARFGAALS